MFQHKRALQNDALSRSRSNSKDKAHNHVQQMKFAISNESSPRPEKSAPQKIVLNLAKKAHFDDKFPTENSAELVLVTRSHESSPGQDNIKIQRNLNFLSSQQKPEAIENKKVVNQASNTLIVENLDLSQVMPSVLVEKPITNKPAISEERLQSILQNKRREFVCKSFKAWRGIVKKYARVKEFIIHKLCVQKMSAKLKLFRIIKSHASAIKREQNNERLSMGFYAANLLGRHLGLWRKKTVSALKNRSNYAVISNYTNSRLIRVVFTFMIAKTKKSLKAKKSLESRVAYLRGMKKRRIFQEVVRVTDAQLFEKNLEKRSDFFFSYWGAREFFKRAFEFVKIRKHERSQQGIADSFRRQRVLAKSYYTLVDYFNYSGSLESQAIFHYLKKLIQKAFIGLLMLWQENKVPEREFTQRQVKIGYKFLSILSNRNYDPSSVRDYLDEQISARQSGIIGKTKAIQKSQNNEDYSESSVSEADKYPADYHRRLESVIEHSYDEPCVNDSDNNQINLSATLYTNRNSNKTPKFQEKAQMVSLKINPAYADSYYAAQDASWKVQGQMGYDQRHVSQSLISDKSDAFAESRIDIESKQKLEYALDYFGKNRTSFIQNMPILAEKINPPKFIHTTFQYNMQVLREYFDALKQVVQSRKAFIRAKQLERTKMVFKAFLKVVNNAHMLRYTAGKIRHKRVKEYLIKSFGQLKRYTRTKKLLRVAEEQYNTAKDIIILQDYFARFQQRAIEVKKEKSQQRECLKFRVKILLSKGFHTLQDYRERNKISAANFLLIKQNYEARIKKEWFSNLLNLAFFKRGLGYGCMNLQRLMQGNLERFAYQLIVHTSEKELRNMNTFNSISAHKNSNFLKKAFFSLESHAKMNLNRKKLNSFASYHYQALLLSKSLIGFNSYSRYKARKRESDVESVKKVELISLHFFLKKWKSKTLFLAKIYHFRDLITRLMKSQFFKQHKDLKQLKITRIKKFEGQTNERALRVFFAPWRRLVQKKRMIQGLRKGFITSNDQKLKQMTFGVWYRKLQNSQNQNNRISVAIRWCRFRTIQKTFSCLKMKAEANSAMQNASGFMATKTKRSVFVAWNLIAQKKKNLAILMRKIKAQKRDQLLRDYWLQLKNRFQTQIQTKIKLQEHRKEQKRKWFGFWAQETNLSRFRVMSNTSLSLGHPTKSPYSEKIKTIWRKKAKLVFQCLRVYGSQKISRNHQSIENYGKIKNSRDSRFLHNFLAIWLERSAARSEHYVSTSKMVALFTRLQSRLTIAHKARAFSLVRVISIHKKKEEKLQKKAEVFLARNMSRKLFQMLREFAVQCRNLKSGFVKLDKVLQDSRSKKEAIFSLFILKKRSDALHKVICAKVAATEILEKRNTLACLQQNVKRHRSLENSLNVYNHRRKLNLKSSVFFAIFRRIQNKKINLNKARKIQSEDEKRQVQHFYGIWMKSVVLNKSSLHNRARNLTEGLRKMHILRTIDALSLFRHVSIEKKAQIASCFSNLQAIISRRTKSSFLSLLRDQVERKVLSMGKISQLCMSLQSHLSLQIKYDSFKQLRKHQGLVCYEQAMKLQRRLHTLGSVFRAFKNHMEHIKEPREKLIAKHQSFLRLTTFRCLKHLALVSESSLWNKSKSLSTKLKLMRKKHILSKLRLNHQLKVHANRKIENGTFRIQILIEAIKHKSMKEFITLLKARYLAARLLLKIQPVLAKSVKRQTFQVIKKCFENAKRQHSFYLFKQKAERKHLWAAFQGLLLNQERGRKLLKDAIQFTQSFTKSTYLREWIDATFNDPDSLHNLGYTAKLNYNESILRKAMRSLTMARQSSILEGNLEAFVLGRNENIKRIVFETLRQKVQLAKQKASRTLILKVFLQWKEFMKNNQLLNNYLIEEKELTESIKDQAQKPSQKERFLNLLMPQLGMYSEASRTRSRFFEMSDRGLDDTEDNSNSFADYKSAFQAHKEGKQLIQSVNSCVF